MASSAVELILVSDGNWRAALELGVLPAQQRFVADHVPIAAVMLAKAYVRPGGLTWAPYLVECDGSPVGMLQLVLAAEADADAWLYHFFIDARQQGRGLGTLALRAFLDLVTELRPAARGVCLTVHPDNVVAQRLYQGHGFVPTGEVQDGEPVYRLALTRQAVERGS